MASLVPTRTPHIDREKINSPKKKPTFFQPVNLSRLVETAFNGLPIIVNPKYGTAISVATPEPINDRFNGVSVNINIKKNTTNNSKILELQMMNFFMGNRNLPDKRD